MAIHKNTIAVIIAVSMVSAIGGLVFNTMSLLLEAISTEFDFNSKQLGKLTLFAGIGYLTGTLSGPLWVDRVNWRFAAVIIVILATLSFAFSSQVHAEDLYIAFTCFGFSCSLAIALSMRVLAEMPNPERAFGTRLSVELILIGGFLIVLPIYFVAKSGFSGAMVGLSLFAALLGLGAFFMPARPNSNVASNTVGFPSWAKASRSWIILGVFLIYLLANVGLFYFLAVLVQGFDPSGEQFALMFAGLKWLGGIAAFFGALVGAKVGFKMPHFVSLTILLVGVTGMIFATNFAVFMISSWIWEIGFTLGCLYQTVAIKRFDPTNKLVVLVPAAFGMSMLAGGWIAGQLLAGGSANSLYGLVAVCSLLPSIFMLQIRSPSSVIVEA